MAPRKSDLEIEIEGATENWLAVEKKIDPVEWEAWTAWRRRSLHIRSVPEKLTVPTPFPPTTAAAAKDYIDVLRKIRKAVGWNDGRARLPSDPAAYGSMAAE